MTEAERLALAGQAKAAWETFFEPMITELHREYAARIIMVATTELNPAKRADKITALSHAHKILDALKGGMLEIIRDGDLASREKVRAEKIEQMTAPQRRLLGMAPY